jgi:bifunctional enzyme CysN/CysC
MRDVLRFMTCGSVDDGKSTLIGRLLYDLGQVPDDQLAALERDSRLSATSDGGLEFGFLLDGLQQEREQGITIDVAYRYFAAPTRKFIVADTPGHEQYTRNMATAASVSDLAVILVDARKGVVTQTRRHGAIVNLLGIRHLVLAINKMDLVAYSQARFDEIVGAWRAFADRTGAGKVVAIPVSARLGDNVVRGSERMPWYTGPTLAGQLESADVDQPGKTQALRLPVQTVIRADENFRGFAGTIVGGTAKPGDPVVVLPSGRTTRIKRLVSMTGDEPLAHAGAAVALVLEDEVDVGRGDVICAAADRPEMADQVSADLIWLGSEPMLPGRSYFMKCGTQSLSASISKLKHKLDIDNLAETAARDLVLNDIGQCNVSCSRPIVFEPYEKNRSLGSFILIDKMTGATVAAGLIRFGLRRASNIHWQALEIDQVARAKAMRQRPLCIWFTGLSGSGKSTVANLLEKRLHALGRHTYVLDGDNVRHGLNRDLGFTDADRAENIRRVAEVARLMVDAGLVVMVSFISPFRAERRMARELFREGEFLEVFVDTSLEVCEQRDAKGLYRKARQGALPNFTGIDSPYEPPQNPDLRLDGAATTPEALVDQIVERIERGA